MHRIQKKGGAYSDKRWWISAVSASLGPIFSGTVPETPEKLIHTWWLLVLSVEAKKNKINKRARPSASRVFFTSHLGQIGEKMSVFLPTFVFRKVEQQSRRRGERFVRAFLF